MDEELLFVYGTLRRDSENDMHRLLAGYATFVADAAYQGRLYIVAEYPGVVPSQETADVVRGEVYRIRRPDILLPKLDEYEGCRPEEPDGEYVRKREPVTLGSGERVSAWVYIYARPTAGLRQLRSGDFRGETSGNVRR